MLEKNGDIINEKDVQPGDVLFFAQKKSDGTYRQPWDGTDKDDIHYKHINHVAIYAGEINGVPYMWEAVREGTPVHLVRVDTQPDILFYARPR